MPTPSRLLPTLSRALLPGALLALSTPSLSAQSCANDGGCPPGLVCIDGTCAPQGERNPLGGEAMRRPARRDDEMVILPATGAGELTLGFAYDEAIATGRHPQGVRGGAAARFLGATSEQVALLRQTSGGAEYEVQLLEPLGLDAKKSAHFDAPLLATWSFTTGNPNVRPVLAAGDVDNRYAPWPDHDFHDELVVVYQDVLPGPGQWSPARVVVMGFEALAPPATDIPAAPTALASIQTAGLMHDSHTELLDVALADLNGDGRKDIAVAYFGQPGQPGAGRVVVECFEVSTDAMGQMTLLPLTIDLGSGPVPAPMLVTTFTRNAGWGLAGGRFDRRAETIGTPREQIAIAGLRGASNLLRASSWSLVGSGSTGPIWTLGIDAETEVSFDHLATHTPSGTQVNPLPNTRVRVAAAEFPSTNGNYGRDRLAVLLDTNYGPFVQVIAFNGTENAGDTGPLYSTTNDPRPVWPTQDGLNNRAATSSVSDAEIWTGNFLQVRSQTMSGGLGSNRANLVVAWPGGGLPLTSFTFGFSGPFTGYPVLDADGLAISGPLATLVTADLDGDSATYVTTLGNGDELLLGEPIHFRASFRAPETTLQEPPKHVDYLQPQGGIVNISQTDGLFVQFSNSQGQQSTVDKKSQVDFTVGDSDSLSVSASVGAAGSVLGGSVSTSVSGALATTAMDSTTYYDEHTSQVTLTQVSKTERDDQLVVREQDVDVWRYPVMGLVLVNPTGTPLPPAEQSPAPFFELHLPDAGFTTFAGGRAVDDYQPYHINGNILSYPPFSSGGFQPPDIGPFEVIDSAGGIDSFPAGTPLWAENSFLVGGSSVNVALSFTQATTSSESFATKDSTKESLDFKVGASMSANYGIVSASASIDYQYAANNEETWASTRSSKNTTSVRTEISLAVPSSIPSQRGYEFFPAWYFTELGGMRVTHAVDPLGGGQAAQQWWLDTYAAPDPALNLPYRLVAAPGGGWELNTDPSRKRAKGIDFFDQTGEPIYESPSDGQLVTIEARVYNLSLVSSAQNVLVRFHAEELNPATPFTVRRLIGSAVIDCIPPHGSSGTCLPVPTPEGVPSNMRVASVVWNTRSFGNASGQGIRDWRIWVTVDPDDAIPNETHELEDRYGDPLLDGMGQPLDRLEKGQNNVGWTIVGVAPDPQDLPATHSGQRPDIWMTADSLRVLDAPGGAGVADAAAIPGESLTLGVRIFSALDDPQVRTLTVRAVDPDGASHLIAQRRVWGVSAGEGSLVTLDWTPPAPGAYMLSAEIDEPYGDEHPGDASDTLLVKARAR